MNDADCVPLKSASFDKTKMRSKRLAEVAPDASLEERCSVVVALHLENYPPEMIGYLDQDAWNSIIKLKFNKTNPKEGKRRTAAITKHYLVAVETENPHLAESTVADKLVWKDLCEFQFPQDGVSRSKGLLFPWPIFVERIKRAGRELLEILQVENDGGTDISVTSKVERAIQLLVESAMNVALLKKSGIGKTIKKFVKHASKLESCEKMKFLFQKRQVTSVKPSLLSSGFQSNSISIIEQAEKLVETWKETAANSGVAITQNNVQYDNQRTLKPPHSNTDNSDCRDLEHCESHCHNWRALYNTLDRLESKRRKKQGERLRQRREHRAKHQPKIIKVRPTCASVRRENLIKHQPIGTKYASATAPRGQEKFRALRDESKIAATWQKSTSENTCQTSSFGNAVAFAGVGKSAKTMGRMQRVKLKGGKSMKVPAKMPVNTLRKKLSKTTYR
mmetsp:Transcript_14441/g.16571  ORF Transcript_14441/g.16571 Transcript_14441/m.16571 type:complete len:449 (+) Transcript_14441:31-1377(+)